MKKNLIILMMVFSVPFFGQIGIGTTSVSDSEILVIAPQLQNESKARGFMLPSVALTSDTDNTTIPNAPHTLTVYRTSGLKGFFYWDDLSTLKSWRRAYDQPGVLQLIVPVKNDVNSSTSGASQSSGTGTATAYTTGLTTGESPTAHSWVLVPGLSKTINIYSAANSITVSASGMLQVNNTTTTSDQTHSYAVGIFVNNKLFSVRTYIASGDSGMSCLGQSFDIKANLENIPVDTYQINVYAITRARLSPTTGTAEVLTWAAPASGCSNLNTFITRNNLAVQTQQF